MFVIEKKIENMRRLSIKECDKEQLTDLSSIEIDSKKSKQERMLDYVRQVNNPYYFKVGDVAVRLVFDEGGRSFQSCMEELIQANIGKENL